MVVKLTPELEARIHESVASGRYDDETAVIRDARDEAQLDRLRGLLQEGLISGGEMELTPELWDELEREADEADRRGDPLDPNVCPPDVPTDRLGPTKQDR